MRCVLSHADNTTWFELGNEQYNPHFAEQVAAMEARATKIGMPPNMLHYLWPEGPGDSPGRPSFVPNATDVAAINALGLGVREKGNRKRTPA